MRWWWRAKKEQPKALSISDPGVLPWFIPGYDGADVDGVSVGERTSLGLSAFWRAHAVVTQTLASLPLRSYTGDELARKQVASIFDEPDGPEGQTPFEWKETLFSNLFLWGRGGALKLRTPGGGLARLQLRHPSTWRAVEPSLDEYASGRLPVGGLWFDVRLDTGETRRYDASDFWYVPAMSLDGRMGESVLTYARRSLATAIAGDRAAAKLFNSGALISGLATPDDEEDIADDIPNIRRELDYATGGADNTGKIAIVSRRLKFTPWTMTSVDAQFLQSRQFQVEEISRWTGVPPHILMQTEKQTSWGTGVDEQNRALGRTVLAPWASRVEERGSRLLARPRTVAFDFAALERPSPDRETELDLSQVAAGVMSKQEYRDKRGWGPLPADAAPPAPPVPGEDNEGPEDGNVE